MLRWDAENQWFLAEIACIEPGSLYHRRNKALFEVPLRYWCKFTRLLREGKYMTDRHLFKSKPTLPLAAAEAIVDGAIAAALAEGFEALSIAILDAGGHLIAFKRQDGAGILRPQIAMGKAWGALGMGASGRKLMERLSSRLHFVAALTDASEGRFVPVPGGVLVLDEDDYVIGAVGISGDVVESTVNPVIVNSLRVFPHARKIAFKVA